MDDKKTAFLTGRAIQDDESFKYEGGFVPERDQFYFELKQGDNVFLLGFKDILKCLWLLQDMKEIPAINGKWWQEMKTIYGGDICILEYR